MTIFQMLIPVISSLVLTALFTPMFINYAHKKKQGQMIRKEGPSWHQVKAGTPTMGGFVFNLAIIVTGLFFLPLFFYLFYFNSTVNFVCLLSFSPGATLCLVT